MWLLYLTSEHQGDSVSLEELHTGAASFMKRDLVAATGLRLTQAVKDSVVSAGLRVLAMLLSMTCAFGFS